MKLHPLLLALGCSALFACNQTVQTLPTVACGDGGLCYQTGAPYSGLATLHPHTAEADVLDSVVSFEHAATVDSGQVNADWDLSLEGAELLSQVNGASDDQSWIVDLGPISIQDVPETVDPAEHEKGPSGTNDLLPAALEHVYLVHNLDSDTQQYVAFRVVALEPGTGVTLQWFRSKDPARFVFPRGETL